MLFKDITLAEISDDSRNYTQSLLSAIPLDVASDLILRVAQAGGCLYGERQDSYRREIQALVEAHDKYGTHQRASTISMENTVLRISGLAIVAASDQFDRRLILRGDVELYQAEIDGVSGPRLLAHDLAMRYMARDRKIINVITFDYSPIAMAKGPGVLNAQSVNLSALFSTMTLTKENMVDFCKSELHSGQVVMSDGVMIKDIAIPMLSEWREVVSEMVACGNYRKDDIANRVRFPKFAITAAKESMRLAVFNPQILDDELHVDLVYYQDPDDRENSLLHLVPRVIFNSDGDPVLVGVDAISTPSLLRYSMVAMPGLDQDTIVDQHLKKMSDLFIQPLTVFLESEKWTQYQDFTINVTPHIHNATARLLLGIGTHILKAMNHITGELIGSFRIVKAEIHEQNLESRPPRAAYTRLYLSVPLVDCLNYFRAIGDHPARVREMRIDYDSPRTDEYSWVVSAGTLGLNYATRNL